MFRKKDVWVQEKFRERLSLFIKDINHPLLNNHPLDGVWFGCRSINITGIFARYTKNWAMTVLSLLP